MSDIKSILKDLESIVEHSAADLHKAAKKEDHTPQEIEAVKNIAKVVYYYEVLKAMTESEEDEGYSERGYARRGGYSSNYSARPYSMDDGMSGARMRDSMGRFTSSRRGGSYNNGSYRGGSYRGYSMDESRDMMLSSLEDALNRASSERERSAIEQCIDTMSAM